MARILTSGMNILLFKVVLYFAVPGNTEGLGFGSSSLSEVGIKNPEFLENDDAGSNPFKSDDQAFGMIDSGEHLNGKESPLPDSNSHEGLGSEFASELDSENSDEQSFSSSQYVSNTESTSHYEEGAEFPSELDSVNHEDQTVASSERDKIKIDQNFLGDDNSNQGLKDKGFLESGNTNPFVDIEDGGNKLEPIMQRPDTAVGEEEGGKEQVSINQGHDTLDGEEKGEKELGSTESINRQSGPVLGSVLGDNINDDTDDSVDEPSQGLENRLFGNRNSGTTDHSMWKCVSLAANIIGVLLFK